ncbi:MAG: hypothetical protein ACQEP5_05065 [Actinomycetota bacterium]
MTQKRCSKLHTVGFYVFKSKRVREGKSCLGMGSYEIRSYTGWHRHMALVFLVMHFLTCVRT